MSSQLVDPRPTRWTHLDLSNIFKFFFWKFSRPIFTIPSHLEGIRIDFLPIRIYLKKVKCVFSTGRSASYKVDAINASQIRASYFLKLVQFWYDLIRVESKSDPKSDADHDWFAIDQSEAHWWSLILSRINLLQLSAPVLSTLVNGGHGFFLPFFPIFLTGLHSIGFW